MPFNLLMGTLNPAHSLTHSLPFALAVASTMPPSALASVLCQILLCLSL